MESVGVNKKSKLSLDGKLNFIYQIKKILALKVNSLFFHLIFRTKK